MRLAPRWQQPKGARLTKENKAGPPGDVAALYVPIFALNCVAAKSSFLQGPGSTMNQGEADSVFVSTFALPDAVGRSTSLIGWL